MKTFIITLILILFTSNVYAGTATKVAIGAGVGYMVAKSGSKKNVVSGGNSGAILGMIPISCWLGDDGNCGAGRSNKVPILKMCRKIGKEYEMVGFTIPNHTRSKDVILLCQKQITIVENKK